MEAEHESVSMLDHDCVVCLESMVDPRYLGCRHVFCAPCLALMENADAEEQYIRCPMCRLFTKLGAGNTADILPAATRLQKIPLGTARRVEIDGLVTSLCVDDRRGVILAATDNNSEQIQMYNFGGELVGGFDHVDLGGRNINVAVDEKRGYIAVSDESSVHMFDAAGSWLWVVTDLQAQYNDIAYDVAKDRLLLADRARRQLMEVNPDTREVRAVPGGSLQSALALAVHETGSGPTGRIVVNDTASKLKFFSLDMSLESELGIGLERFGAFTRLSGLAVDGTGRVLACDAGTKRVVRVSEDGGWDCLLSEEDFDYHYPHVLALSRCGVMAVTSYIERKVEDTTSTLHIYDGYD